MRTVCWDAYAPCPTCRAATGHTCLKVGTTTPNPRPHSLRPLLSEVK